MFSYHRNVEGTKLIFTVVSLILFAHRLSALGNFNKKLDRRFENIEKNVEKLKYEVLHDYVLKEDFLREMQAVHSKLDRILDHLLNK